MQRRQLSSTSSILFFLFNILSLSVEAATSSPTNPLLLPTSAVRQHLDVTTAITEVDGFLQTTDGASIYYQMKGDLISGYPLILLHGGEWSKDRCKGLTSWDPQFDFFAQYYKVVRFDMRYCGKSSNTGKIPFNWQWLSESERATKDVVELMEKLGISQGHILGLSIGSAVAAQLAVFYPEKVSKLILSSPWQGNTLPRNTNQLQALKMITNKTLIIGGDGQYSYELDWAKSQSYTPLSIFIENAGHFSIAISPNCLTNIYWHF